MTGTPSAVGVQLERNPYAPDPWDIDFDSGVRVLPSSGRRQQVLGSGDVIPADVSEDSDIVVFDRVHRGRLGAATNAEAASTRRLGVGGDRPLTEFLQVKVDRSKRYRFIAIADAMRSSDNALDARTVRRP